MDWLYTLFKYRFSGETVLKSGQLFDILQGSSFQPAKQRSGQNAQHKEKRLLREKSKKHLLSFFQKTKSTQTIESVFADTIEQVKKTKFEIEQIKIVDGFLDFLGNYTSNLVSFKIKSL